MNRKKLACCMAALVLALTGCASGGGKNSSSASSATASQSEEQAGTQEKKEKKQKEKIIAEETLELSQESGTYASGFELTISPKDGQSGDIYYTLDGSDPRTSSTRIRYDSPVEITDRSSDANIVSAVDVGLISGNFTKYDRREHTYSPTVSAPADSAVDKCTVIRAALDGADSVVSTRTYFIGDMSSHIPGAAAAAEASGKPLAVISISMDYNDLFDYEKGIYVKGKIFDEALEQRVAGGENLDEESARKMPANYNQRGKDWERTCSAEMLEVSADGVTTAFSQTCGIRIQGNYSRSDWQKGFRLYARKDYGTKQFYSPVFGEENKDIDGDTIDSYKTLELRAGGNCAFLPKFNDIYWQVMSAELDCATKASRPCVVYLNGEYWGVYILEEDYSDNFMESHYCVDNGSVVIYKGDAETYQKGYKLDEGKLPDGVTDEDYFIKELNTFLSSHNSLADQSDFDELAKLVDTDSLRDYFLAEVWINNKWDWPGKNWSMWRTAENDGSEYGDGRWRFMFYDMEFGGVSGMGDAYTNTVKEDNYKPKGLLDQGTNNPAVKSFALAMTNDAFRADFCERLNAMGSGIYEEGHANEVLDGFTAAYSPLFDQFFARYPGSGDTDNAINGGYGSVQCIKDFLGKRADAISSITDWIEKNI
ncbi:Spore coat protein CotH [Ruminococcus sp. YE71]|uniref:CotH kinase family protein n=1 Tax=unclassified Ruminococcus TaxID=2608920 RepID=UPI000885C1F4|nr:MULTISPECIES: CotH kinase family protein [unclassified Ruminococcus]SDA12169.1 Spore coat protein CotH [Ruminococcus sp. YE78]SFW16464.1 Spore coat protein CotH [Ruminococcus sp. YE71]